MVSNTGIKDFKPHLFKQNTFLPPTYCIFCGELLWGLKKQGQICRECKAPAHEYCVTMNTDSPCNNLLLSDKPKAISYPKGICKDGHYWIESTIMLSTCHQCGMVIVKDGFKCKHCFRKVHRPCHKVMPVCENSREGLHSMISQPMDRPMSPTDVHWSHVQASTNLSRRNTDSPNLLRTILANRTISELPLETTSLPSTPVIPARHARSLLQAPPLPPSLPPAIPPHTRCFIEFAPDLPPARRSIETPRLYPRSPSAPNLQSLVATFEHKYTRTEHIGSGAFGNVFFCTNIETGKKYAVKEILKRRFALQRSMLMKFKNECEVVLAVIHPHIIRAVEVFQTKVLIQIVMERADMDVAAYIQPPTDGNYYRNPEWELRYIFYQVLLAVQYLHHSNITHRDLKLENILMLKSDDPKYPMTVKLADFGLARWLDENGVAATYAGTANYMAPEIANRIYNELVDMWSMGVILFRMFTGRFLKSASDPTNDLEALKNETNPLPVSVVDLLSHLLVVDPNSRWSVDDSIAHQWFFKDPDLYSSFRPLPLRKKRTH